MHDPARPASGRERDRNVRSRVRRSGSPAVVFLHGPARPPDVARAHGEARRIPLPGARLTGFGTPLACLSRPVTGPRRRAHREERPRTAGACRRPLVVARSPTPFWTATPARRPGGDRRCRRPDVGGGGLILAGVTVVEEGATTVTPARISPPPHHVRTPAPSITARSTSSGWRSRRVWVIAPPHERPTTCARRAGALFAMSAATRSAVTGRDRHARWLLRPKPGRSGARQWNPASLAVCSRHIRPVAPAPCRNTTAGEPGVPDS